ncbi:MAG: response regulator transcription factor [Rhodoferax sp.]|uniref:response regulator transcription factor n=1 Tax=Rhodoferax sp. TaxID=50421 RepID=UPI002614ACE5|nr:response regulator transcription factor [Rhodoferax sp.]MDD5336021.1 response regulator transcription factor [Rhodoferax sp.]
MKVLKILVVDDHALVREGLRQVLKGLDEQVEVLEAAHCVGAFEIAAQHCDLDLVLLDYHLPDMNGLDALTIFSEKHPELPIVMLSGSVNPQIARKVMQRGASGFITKASLSSKLLSILSRVLAGEVYLPTELLSAGSLPCEPEADAAPLLTSRQEEVLYLLLEGRSNKEISQLLQLSDETTKNHVTGVLRAFGVQNRVQAVLAAAQLGYVKTSPSV